MSRYTWLLDPGHGGIIDGVYQTAGKRSPRFPDGSILYEGEFNRDVVKRIMQLALALLGMAQNSILAMVFLQMAKIKVLSIWLTQRRTYPSVIEFERPISYIKSVKTVSMFPSMPMLSAMGESLIVRKAYVHFITIKARRASV